MTLGSGFRLLLDVIGPDAAERVRADLTARCADDPATVLCADVLYARATVP